MHSKRKKMMKYIFLFALFLFMPYEKIMAQGDLTHEVAADTVQWPVPHPDASWQLEYLPHNNAHHNV